MSTSEQIKTVRFILPDLSSHLYELKMPVVWGGGRLSGGPRPTRSAAMHRRGLYSVATAPLAHFSPLAHAASLLKCSTIFAAFLCARSACTGIGSIQEMVSRSERTELMAGVLQLRERLS